MPEEQRQPDENREPSDEAESPVMDAFLREYLGAETAPDLSRRILDRIAEVESAVQLPDDAGADLSSLDLPDPAIAALNEGYADAPGSQSPRSVQRMVKVGMTLALMALATLVLTFALDRQSQDTNTGTTSAELRPLRVVTERGERMVGLADHAWDDARQARLLRTGFMVADSANPVVLSGSTEIRADKGRALVVAGSAPGQDDLDTMILVLMQDEALSDLSYEWVQDLDNWAQFPEASVLACEGEVRVQSPQVKTRLRAASRLVETSPFKGQVVIRKFFSARDLNGNGELEYRELPSKYGEFFNPLDADQNLRLSLVELGKHFETHVVSSGIRVDTESSAFALAMRERFARVKHAFESADRNGDALVRSDEVTPEILRFMGFDDLNKGALKLEDLEKRSKELEEQMKKLSESFDAFEVNIDLKSSVLPGAAGHIEFVSDIHVRELLLPEFEKVDTNGDGKVSQAEIAKLKLNNPMISSVDFKALLTQHKFSADELTIDQWKRLQRGTLPMKLPVAASESKEK